MSRWGFKEESISRAEGSTVLLVISFAYTESFCWASSQELQIESPGLDEVVVVQQKKRLPFSEEMRGDMIAGYQKKWFTRDPAASKQIQG